VGVLQYHFERYTDTVIPVVRIRDVLSRIPKFFIPDPDPGYPDPGGKKHRIPDPTAHKKRDEK
jgi:hypothetical protein